jgi:ATP phosphoribosyltransferase regulatory subunit
MRESHPSLRALLSDAGYAFVEPAIVFDASVFVELAGEDLRRRLFLTNGADGTEMALRPDYTIPVCLHHLATGPAKRRAGYAYLGPVFRQRRDEPGEFLQAGIESLGRTDRVAADADVLKLALDAAGLLGVRKPAVRIGDSALFAALLDALDLNLSWQRRLARAFGDPQRLRALIARADGGGNAAGVGGATLDRAGRTAARKRVEALFASTGIRTIGGRTTGEIVDRVAEKTALAAGIGRRAAKVLLRFLDIAGTPAKAVRALRALQSRAAIDIGPAVDRLEKRIAALAGHGIDPAGLSFAADFGRRLDYYTGFVFEIHDAARHLAQIVGGGRYDRLMALIGAGEAVPAVGFAIWLDRIGGGR